MAQFRFPTPGQPLVRVEPTGETSIGELEREAVVDCYKRHGALLFRGFGCDLDAFQSFAWRFCRTAVINETPGRAPLDPAHLVYAVDSGTNAFALHPELSRQPFKPDLAMFGCLSAPGQGGMTTLCDGIELVRALPAAVREGLAGRRLVYGTATWPELLAFWLGSSDPGDALLRNPPAACPYRFERVPDGRVVKIFSRPALHRPMFSDELAFGNFLLFARFNNGRSDFPVLDDLRPVPEQWLQAIKATGDRLSMAVDWREGDLLMLDNTRFMHGRTAIRDVEERQIATFFGYLDFAVPDPEEPPGAIWRRENFEPPRPPDHLVRRP